MKIGRIARLGSLLVVPVAMLVTTADAQTTWYVDDDGRPLELAPARTPTRASSMRSIIAAWVAGVVPPQDAAATFNSFGLT